LPLIDNEGMPTKDLPRDLLRLRWFSLLLFLGTFAPGT